MLTREAARGSTPGVVVLGMHRSGTSLATRLVSLLGLTLGRGPAVPATEGNARGHSESAVLRDLNDDLLARLGGNWAGPPPLDDGWERDNRLDAVRREARSAFARVYGPSPDPWVWKDPRNCITFPFWEHGVGIRAVVVLVHRNPLAVADSLFERDGLSCAVALALWERYVRDSLCNSSGHRVLSASSDEIVEDPVGWVARVRDVIRGAGIDLGPGPDDGVITSAIDVGLLHHASYTARDLRADAHASEAQCALFDVLGKIAGSHDDFVVPDLPAPTAGIDSLLTEHARFYEEREALREKLARGASATGASSMCAGSRSAPTPSTGGSEGTVAEPAVTVCVPSFNGMRHLEDCLDSVAAQTFDDFEVLVVDDASTDGTAAAAESFRARDPRVRVESNPRNLGLVRNWNRCVELARGRWLKFVFQDDVIAPTCVEALMQARRPDCPLVVCRRTLRFDDDREATRDAYSLSLEHSLDRLFGEVPYVSAAQVQAAVLDHVGVNFVGEPTAVLVERSAFDQFGRFNEALVALCDFEYWARVGSNTGLAYVPESLATFRVHVGSASEVNRTELLFHKDWLDPLLLQCELATAPPFAPVRGLAASRGIDLCRSSLDLAARARRHAEQALRAAQPPNRAPLRAWRQVVASYPFLARAPRLRALDVKYAVGRTVRSRRPHPTHGARRGRGPRVGSGRGVLPATVPPDPGER